MANLPKQPGDVECYKNYFLLKLYDPVSKTFRDFDMWPGKPLNIIGLRMALSMCTLVTFNGKNYDEPMIAAALMGADNATLKGFSDAIIVGRLKPWEFYRMHGVQELHWLDHIDLMEVAPGVGVGLKMYGCRMAYETIEDLPYDPATTLSPEQMAYTNHYCGNDLGITWALYEACEERLKLREDIGGRFGVDVRSKSDAQIAESVIKAQLPFSPVKTQIPHGFQFYYKAPDFMSFSTPKLQALLHMVQTTPFIVNDVDQIRQSRDEEVFDSDGRKISTGVQIPAAIKGTDIVIGSTMYRMGIGGLHSQESSIWHMTTDTHEISDHDVGSYYPSLILLMGMYPIAIGPEFIPIYTAIYRERLDAKDKAGAAKKAGDKAGEKHWKTIADGLKITLNGTFGKLGSKYSILFAPELLIRTTITGQLALLMLIEAFENVGISVVSANTDGIVLKTPRHFISLRDEIIAWWEYRTGLQMEATFYKAIFSRDVNNYVAFKMDGTHKGKGVFADPGVLENKHPDREICKDAVIAYLGHGTPIAQTVRSCQDIRKFLRVRNVKGGGSWLPNGKADMTGSTYVDTGYGSYDLPKANPGDGQYLGKSVRWYYGLNRSALICYANGNKVADSEGAVPMMRLTAGMPTDIDFAYYERAAAEMVRTLGVC